MHMHACMHAWENDEDGADVALNIKTSAPTSYSVKGHLARYYPWQLINVRLNIETRLKTDFEEGLSARVVREEALSQHGQGGGWRCFEHPRPTVYT